MRGQLHLAALPMAAVCALHRLTALRHQRRIRSVPTTHVLPQVVLSEEGRLAVSAIEIAQSHVHRLRMSNGIPAVRHILVALPARERAVPRHHSEVLFEHAVPVDAHLGDWSLVHVHAQRVRIQAGPLHKGRGAERTAQPLRMVDAPMVRQPPALVEHRIAFGTAHHRRPDQVAALAVLLHGGPVDEATAALGHVAHVAAAHGRSAGQIRVAAMRAPVVHALAERVECLVTERAGELRPAIVVGVVGVAVSDVALVAGAVFCGVVSVLSARTLLPMAGQLSSLSESTFAEFAAQQFGEFADAAGFGVDRFAAAVAR